MSRRIVTLAPASVARADLYARMADQAYDDYLRAHVAYSDAITARDSVPAPEWHGLVKAASAARASGVEVMRVILELAGFRRRPVDAEDVLLDPIAWYEKHLLGGL